MTKEELEQKQQESYKLALEISQLHKILGIKQNQFNKLDTEIYKELKAQQENGTYDEPTSEDNK